MAHANPWKLAASAPSGRWSLPSPKSTAFTNARDILELVTAPYAATTASKTLVGKNW
jgi:hypothetical protein